MFFGCRSAGKDYLYREEWQYLKENGVLSDVVLAPSRDQASKVYVQHRIREHAAAVFDLLQRGEKGVVAG